MGTSIGIAGLRESKYLFIDGGYLQDKYEKIQPWFEGHGEINFLSIKGEFGAKKVFYYDCLDDQKRGHESQADFDLRLDQQKQFFNKIRELEGFHVQLGTLVGNGKKRRQKEVDILLAVDMMNHAIRGNMNTGILLSGDRDFRPLVQSLVQMGTYVLISSAEESTAKEFIWAADFHHKIKFHDLYEWSSPSLKAQYPLPACWTSKDDHETYGLSLIKEISVNGYEAKLYESEGLFLIYFPIYKSFEHYFLKGNDLNRLELFLSLKSGQK
jgi:uncharacterized LabA/DUF88 family protein